MYSNLESRYQPGCYARFAKSAIRAKRLGLPLAAARWRQILMEGLVPWWVERDPS
jgi:hypothetical protein